jgi:hypothetical protein
VCWAVVPAPLSSLLYPDIAPFGSLAVAVRALAAEHGLDLGSIDACEQGWALCGAVLRRGRRDVRLVLGSEERWVIAECWQRGARLSSGKTPDLLAMTAAAKGFLRGDRLADLRDRHPFMSASELALAFESGNEVAVKWRMMLTHPEDVVRRVAVAAAAEPALLSLYPYTSHRNLRFSRCTGYPFTSAEPVIVPVGDKRYRVLAPGGAVLADGVDASSAVAAVVAALPTGCGPAVSGTADDLA